MARLHGRDAAEAVGKSLSARWGCNKWALRELLLDFLARTERTPPPLSSADLRAGVDKCRRRALLGAMSCSVEYYAHRQPPRYDFAGRLASRRAIQQVIALARGWGKESSSPGVSKCRAIFPLGAILCVVDRSLAIKLEAMLNSVRVKQPGDHERRRETSDMAFHFNLKTVWSSDARPLQRKWMYDHISTKSQLSGSSHGYAAKVCVSH